MKINNRFNLFFCTTIFDIRMGAFPHRHPLFDVIERKANHYLEEFHFLLKGKQITVFDGEVIVETRTKNYATTVIKIKSILKTIFYFVPAVLLKAFVWIFDFSYVNQRTKSIFELLKRQSDFTHQSDPHIIPAKVFTQIHAQEQSPLNIPIDLQSHISLFLDDKDVASFALTCKENYNSAERFSAKPHNQCKYFPRLIVQTLGMSKLTTLPFSKLPGIWQVLFKNQEEWLSDGFENPSSIEEVQLLLMCHTMKSGCHVELSSLMDNSSIQQVQLPKGRALILRVRDNILNEEKTFVVAKIKENWTIISRYLSGAMYLFLKDMYLNEDTPKVTDYLTRLFKGEPCGSFPDDLNSKIKIKYEQEKASDRLEEGPRLCSDGITPVIQLWPPMPA